MIRIVCALVAVACLMPSPAQAFPEFWKVWKGHYIAGHKDKKFAEDANKAKCYVCHQGRKKSDHNPYGIHFVGKLNKKEKKDNKKTLEMIKKIGKMHSDSTDKKSPTYDEMVDKGKLPGGTLEEAKKPPKKKKKDDKKKD